MRNLLADFILFERTFKINYIVKVILIKRLVEIIAEEREIIVKIVEYLYKIEHKLCFMFESKQKVIN